MQVCHQRLLLDRLLPCHANGAHILMAHAIPVDDEEGLGRDRNACKRETHWPGGR